MAGPMGAFDYISDDGATYRMRLDVSNATAVGGTAGTVTATSTYPKGRVPRYLLAMNTTTRRERKIVVPDPGNAIWTASGGVVSLIDYATNTVANHNILGRVGERRYFRAG